MEEQLLYVCIPQDARIVSVYCDQTAVYCFGKYSRKEDSHRREKRVVNNNNEKIKKQACLESERKDRGPWREAKTGNEKNVPLVFFFSVE